MHPLSTSFPLLVNQYFKTTNANLKFISFLKKKNSPGYSATVTPECLCTPATLASLGKEKLCFQQQECSAAHPSWCSLTRPFSWAGAALLCRVICIVFIELPFMARRRIQTGGKKEEEWWKLNEGDNQKPNFSFVFCILVDETGCRVLCAALNGCPSAPACSRALLVPAQLLACSAQTSPSTALAPSKHK